MMVRCACCGTNVAELRDGLLIISGDHHGRRHVTAVNLDHLSDWHRNRGRGPLPTAALRVNKTAVEATAV